MTTDTLVLTAICSDYGYEMVFSRLIEALGRKCEIFISYSTSGKSKNILEPLSCARSIGTTTIAFTVRSVGPMDALCDQMLDVCSTLTLKIQKCNLILGHTLCGLVEDSIFAWP